MFGGFYSHVDRNYTQRLPTPGYRRVHRRQFLGVRAPSVPMSGDRATASLPNSPYNADLPYDIKQKALFGEASYEFGQFKLTAGGRYYDFKETRDFISGGLFSNGDNRIGDKTKSNGFSPRVHRQLGAEPQPQRQRPGRQGLPPRRRQRSAQHAALQRRTTRPSSAPFQSALRGRDAVEL